MSLELEIISFRYEAQAQRAGRVQVRRRYEMRHEVCYSLIIPLKHDKEVKGRTDREKKVLTIGKQDLRNGLLKPEEIHHHAAIHLDVFPNVFYEYTAVMTQALRISLLALIFSSSHRKCKSKQCNPIQPVLGILLPHDRRHHLV